MSSEVNTRETSITFGQVFFLFVSGWWLYGLYTTFSHGRIPIFGWITEHNLILGLLWVVVFGTGAAVPAKTFLNYSAFVAVTKRGRHYYPLFLGNVLLQLYVWVLFVTIWFPSRQPWPLENVKGGLLRGLMFLPLVVGVAAVGNLLCVRVFKKMTADLDGEAELRTGDDRA